MYLLACNQLHHNQKVEQLMIRFLEEVEAAIDHFYFFLIFCQHD